MNSNWNHHRKVAAERGKIEHARYERDVEYYYSDEQLTLDDNLRRRKNRVKVFVLFWFLVFGITLSVALRFELYV